VTVFERGRECGRRAGTVGGPRQEKATLNKNDMRARDRS
jgi:hypothetical protein